MACCRWRGAVGRKQRKVIIGLLSLLQRSLATAFPVFGLHQQRLDELRHRPSLLLVLFPPCMCHDVVGSETATYNDADIYRCQPPLSFSIVVPDPKVTNDRPRDNILLGLCGIHDDTILLGNDIRFRIGRRCRLGGLPRLHCHVSSQSCYCEQVWMPTVHVLRCAGIRNTGFVILDLLRVW